MKHFKKTTMTLFDSFQSKFKIEKELKCSIICKSNGYKSNWNDAIDCIVVSNGHEEMSNAKEIERGLMSVNFEASFNCASVSCDQVMLHDNITFLCTILCIVCFITLKHYPDILLTYQNWFIDVLLTCKSLATMYRSSWQEEGLIGNHALGYHSYSWL